MPTPTPRIGYQKPLLSDPYEVADDAARWDLADDYPGCFIFAGTPPAWSPDQEGMFAVDTDTGLLWRWNGTGFVRHGAVGHLVNDRRTADLTVATGTYTTVASAAVSVPDGGRNVAVTVAWGEISGGPARLGIFRGATMLTDWKASGDGGSYTYVDLAPASGAQTYTLKVKNTAGTTTVECASDSPASIDAVEI